MKNHHAKKRSILTQTLIIVLVGIASTPIFAQQPGRRGIERRETAGERLRREKNERQLAEMELRSVENLGKTKPVEKPRERLLYDRIREDFEQLQVVNNEMMRSTFAAGSATNFRIKNVSKALAEINRRATRLRSNLKLPEPEDEAQRQARPSLNISNVQQLKVALVELDDLVMSFIENPTFVNPGVVNVEQSVRARLDLEGIIELSRMIKQKADLLEH